MNASNLRRGQARRALTTHPNGTRGAAGSSEPYAATFPRTSPGVEWPHQRAAEAWNALITNGLRVAARSGAR